MLKTDYSDQKLCWQQKYQQKKNKLENKNEKKNNCMDTSSDKPTKSHTNQRHKDYIKEKINQTQQNSRCRDEKINHIISEYVKLSYKGYKTRNDWVAKEV